MTLVATLIANPDRPAITGTVLTDARDALRTAHPPRLLHHGIAAEFLVDAAVEQIPEATAQLRQAVASQPIDVAVLPAGPHRRKRLFLADMDSTMIAQECIDELADVLGIKAEVAEITERAMRGEIAFEPALRQRVALLKGLPASVADDLIANRITLMPGAGTLLATMKAHGARTCLVSGGFSLFTGPIARMLGFDETRANELDLVDGRLSGTVVEPIVGAEAKRATLMEIRKRLGLASDDTMAVGDGANDLAMLGEAGIGVAFRAKPAVAAAAHVRIEHGDLTALLYLQGFSAAEFVG